MQANLHLKVLQQQQQHDNIINLIQCDIGKVNSAQQAHSEHHKLRTELNILNHYLWCTSRLCESDRGNHFYDILNMYLYINVWFEWENTSYNHIDLFFYHNIHMLHEGH